MKIFVQGHKYFDLQYHSDIYYKYIIGDSHPVYNIDSLNRIFSEYCQMYWVWKNLHYNPDEVICFCHYSRQIDSKYINTNLIQNNDYIQAFYQVVYSVDMNNNRHYKLLSGWCKYLEGIPSFLYDDLEEYLDQQTLINTDFIKEYTNHNPFHLHARCIYAARYERCYELIQFIHDYVEYVANKHNIKSSRDWIYHVKDIIEYVKQHASNNTTYVKRLYQSSDNFKRIWNKDYGLFGNCNTWRIYSYIIEYLISIYIHCNKYFYNKIL